MTVEAVVELLLDDIDEDPTFRFRAVLDVNELPEDLRRNGLDLPLGS